MNDEIWAPDAGTIYPVGTRNPTPTPKGTMLAFDGATSVLKIGAVLAEGSFGRLDVVAESGDSGSAVFHPQANGKANIHGMVIGTTASYAIHLSYDYVRSELGLVW